MDIGRKGSDLGIIAIVSMFGWRERGGVQYVILMQWDWNKRIYLKMG